jgi:outer membrane protein assembly factor BamB
MGSAVIVDNHVYGTGHMNNSWYCVDMQTGNTVYRERSMSRANTIYADGMLYSYSERGTMHLIKPNPERFEMISSFDVELGTGPHFSHPVINNGVLYIRHGDTLMAYDIKAK